MGLPIYGLVVGAWSAADGIQRSVPAPGPGLQPSHRWDAIPLGEALQRHGLDADDVGL